MNADKMRFLYKLIPSRPTFVQDMTETERKVMQEHGIYWNGMKDLGIAIVFGLVLDPKGPWGLGIVEVENEQDAHAIGKNDPAVKAGLTFEVYLMPKM
jgi:uncharacterized protein YciI